MNPSLGDLLARMRAGESLAAVRRSLLPPSWRPTLVRCTVAGVFDGEEYEGLLRAEAPGGGQPALDELADRMLVEPVPDLPGGFRVPSGDHDAYRPTSLTPELRDLERRLADRHAARGDRVEQLRHLLAAEPDAARELFGELYAAADRALDFARCQDLLDVLGDPERLGWVDVADLRAEWAAYLAARTLWRSEHYQSAHFLAPAGLAERAAALLVGTGGRVWQIHGRGGIGKTMQVRWLIARYCVPEPQRVPCARIDFDVSDPVTCGHHPWLVPLMAADQLSRQLARNPFSRLLRTYQRWLLLGGRSGPGPEPLDKETDRRAAATVPDLFVAGLRQLGDRPVLLVLDTVEELSLRYERATGDLVDLLAQVHDACPQLRLVLSGRYDLCRRVPALAERFPRLVDVAVRELTPGESETYLADVRGIDRPDLRSVIVRRAGGLPFALALYADVVRSDPAVSADELGKIGTPGLVYLVDRVVDRIHDPLVRWLLRYGAVPRRLTREFVSDVIAPFLAAAAAGDTSADDPRRDPVSRWRGRALYRTDLRAGPADLDRAWEELLRYTGESSWVSRVEGEPDMVVFHGDVLAPMRAVLAAQEVSRALHERAVAHYTARAAAEPDRATAHTREALYHRFQLDTAGAQRAWRAAVERARVAGRHAQVEDLAAEVVGPEYLDPDGNPWRRLDGSPLVSTDVLVEAHVARAYAAVAEALHRPAGQAPPMWSDARASLLRLAAYPAEADRLPADLASMRAAAEAGLLLADGRPGQAHEVAAAALPRAGRHDSALLLARVLADGAAAAGAAGPGPAYESAIALAAALGRPADELDLLLAASRERARNGRLDEALGWCDRAVRLADTLGQGGRAGARLQRMELRLARCEPAAALDEPLPTGDADALPRYWRLVASARLRLRQPLAALAALEQAGRATDALSGGDARTTHLAENLQARGAVLGELLDLDGARRCFEQASSLWVELGFPHGHRHVTLGHATFLLRAAGDVRDATALLAQGPEDHGDDDAVRLELVRAELMDRAGAGERARNHLEWLLALVSDRPARLVAEVATTGLVLTGDAARFAPALAAALERIGPVPARLGPLDDLARCRILPPDAAASFFPVRRAVAAGPAGDDRHPRDQALGELLLAHVDRVAGDRVGARRRLAAAVAGLSDGAESFVCWDAACPPTLAGREGLPRDLHERFGWELAGWPTLRAAYRVALAAERVDHDDPDSADALLRDADALLSATATVSRWHAQALELRARIAAMRGAPEAPEDAARAATTYRQLGDLARARAVEPAAPAGVADVPPAVVGEVRARLGAFPREEPFDLERQAGSFARDPARLARTLTDLLRAASPPGPPPAGDGGTRPVRLESADLDVHTQPWELVDDALYRALPADLTHRREIRWLRRAADPLLAGGGGDVPPHLRDEVLAAGSGRPSSVRLGPSSRRLLEDLLARRADPADRRALVVRPSSDRDYGSGWLHLSRGVDVAGSYSGAGMDVRVVENPDPAMFTELGLTSSATVPAVVHVSGRLEVSGTLLYMDFTPEEYSTRVRAKTVGETGLFPSTLVSWLQAIPDDVAPPVVVLDPAPPTSPEETALLLLARNRFAAQLFVGGDARVVVAAGLSAARDPYPLAAFARGLAGGKPLGWLVRDLRTADELGPPSPAALFADTPSITLGSR